MKSSELKPLRNRSLVATVLLSLFSLASAPAMAQDSSETSWGLGVAAVSSQKAYHGIDRDNNAFPLLFIENSWIKVTGPTAELKLGNWDFTSGQAIDFRVVAKYDGSGYKLKDSSVFDGMQERKGGFWAGGKVTWQNGFADVSAEVLADVSGKSKGQMMTLGLDKTWSVGERLTLKPRVAATWLSKKYVDYYYGVRAAEATAARPAYVGKSALTAEIGATATYMLDAKQSVFLDVNLRRIPDEIKLSPLVSRSTENRISVGYIYRFQ